MYLIPELQSHPTFPKFVSFYRNVLIRVYSAFKQVSLLDCMPGSISPKVEQAAIEAFDQGVYFQADTITCVDIDTNVIEELRRMMSVTKLHVRAFSGDLTALPFSNQSFNVITVNHPFDDLLYYLVNKDNPDLKVVYNLETSGESVANQSSTRGAMLDHILTKKSVYLDMIKKILLSEPIRVLTNKGLLVIVNYFTPNWRRYDRYLNFPFSERMFEITHDFFSHVCSHVHPLKDITQSIDVDIKTLFSSEDRIEYTILTKS